MFQQGGAAAALDAADGVIDGKFYGRNIVQAGAPQFGTPMGGYQMGGISSFGGGFGGTSGAAMNLDAADGVIDGKFFGRQIVQQGTPSFGAVQSFGTPVVSQVQSFGTPVMSSGLTSFGGGFSQVGGANQSALALDAADGRIDGRFFGRPIVQQSGIQSFGTTGISSFQPVMQSTTPAFTTGGVSSAALSLDAADGVIDGRHFGRPIVQAGSPQIIQSAPMMMQTAGISSFGQAQGSNALALDAADGRIDGKFFGRPIVQGGQAQIFQTQPQIIHHQQPQMMMVQTQPQGSAALNLDAADGRIDGKFFGRPIVQAGGQQQFFQQRTTGGGAAAALDAADGVIDGKFYGRPIVQAHQHRH